LKVPAVCWFTNIKYKRKEVGLTLTKKYNSKDYLKYDNYDAIEVPKVENIPLDYDGIIGVPITFL
jgi:modification methylase ecoRI